MDIHYFINRFGLPEGIKALLVSFVWTVVAIAVGYVVKRLDLVGTEEAVALAVAIRSLVSGIFAYLKVQRPTTQLG